MPIKMKNVPRKIPGVANNIPNAAVNSGLGGATLAHRRHRPVKQKRIERPELFLIPNETIFSVDADEVEATYEAMEKMGIAHLPYPLVDIGVEGSLIMRWEYKEGSNQHKISVALPGRMQYVANNHDPLTCPACLQKFPNPTVLEVPKVIPAGSPLSEVEHAIDEMQAAGQTHKTIGEYTSADFRRAVEIIGAPYKDWALRYRFENEVLIESAAITPNGKAYSLGNMLHANEEDAAMSASASLRRILIVLLATKNIVKERTKDKLLAMGIGANRKKNNYRPLYTTTLSLPIQYTRDDGQPASVGISPCPHLRRGHVRRQKYGPKLAFMKIIWIEPCFVNADDEFVSSRSAYNTSARENHPLLAREE